MVYWNPSLSQHGQIVCYMFFGFTPYGYTPSNINESPRRTTCKNSFAANLALYCSKLNGLLDGRMERAFNVRLRYAFGLEGLKFGWSVCSSHSTSRCNLSKYIDYWSCVFVRNVLSFKSTVVSSREKYCVKYVADRTDWCVNFDWTDNW